MIFQDWWILFFIPFLIPILYFYRRKKEASVRFSSKEILGKTKSFRILLSESLIYLRLLSLTLFIIALARPQKISGEIKRFSEGIDIVFAIDCSTSMLAEDFTLGRVRQNRLEVVKLVIEDFIRKRKSDRIGIIAFAARAYTVCPLTLDYDWLIKNLERIEIGSIEDGTAIGSAIASSLNRLRDSKAKSRIIILLTDGVNNTGKISPLNAAEITKTFGVKIYTIGAGTKGYAPYPVRTPWGETVYKRLKVEIDEDMLKRIAKMTNGRYFRATDTESLKHIYDEIDSMEKSPFEEIGYQKFEELFVFFLIPALVLLVVEMVLSNTIFRKIP